jgi:hypothetical protein
MRLLNKEMWRYWNVTHHTAIRSIPWREAEVYAMQPPARMS